MSDAPSKTSPQTPADVLRAAADLIDKPGAWTQGSYWRGEAADDQHYYSERVPTNACSFCMVGAVARVIGDTPEAICTPP